MFSQNLGLFNSIPSYPQAKGEYRTIIKRMYPTPLTHTSFCDFRVLEEGGYRQWGFGVQSTFTAFLRKG